MAQPYVGEIRLFGGSFAPVGWALCDGSQLAISNNEVLFNLIGTTYGGNGQTTFNLPDLRSRVPVHQGTAPGNGTYIIGQSAGFESVTLVDAQMPTHTHPLYATNAQQTNVPAANTLPAAVTTGQSGALVQYGTASPDAVLSSQSITVSPGGQPHANIQPYLCVNFIIALYGVYPSQG